MGIGNTVTISGNLTADPEIRSAPSGAAVASFTVAHNRSWTDNKGERQEKTSFIDVTAWERLAENAVESLTKGTRVIVEGRLEQETWEDQDGNKRSKVRIVADELAPSLKWATASVTKNDRDDSAPAPKAKAKAKPAPDEEPF